MAQGQNAAKRMLAGYTTSKPLFAVRAFTDYKKRDMARKERHAAIRQMINEIATGDPVMIKDDVVVIKTEVDLAEVGAVHCTAGHVFAGSRRLM